MSSLFVSYKPALPWLHVQISQICPELFQRCKRSSRLAGIVESCMLL